MNSLDLSDGLGPVCLLSAESETKHGEPALSLLYVLHIPGTNNQKTFTIGLKSPIFHCILYWILFDSLKTFVCLFLL